MAEVELPPIQPEPEVPEEQLPQVEKPTEKSKVISVNFNPLNTKATSSLDTRESFYTTDTDAWIVLNVGDMNEPTGKYSLALINKEDGSIFQRTGDIVQGVAYYKLLPNEIKHAGRWVGQAVITLANGQTTASRFSFNVSGHILDGKDVREIVIQDFQTLMAQLNDLKDNETNEFGLLKNEIEAFQIIVQENEDGRQATELERVAAEIMREESYESKVTAAIVEADVVEKVDNKVAELTPTIQNVTAQLAENVYLVGDNQPYKTLNEAFAQWQADLMPTAFIHVKKTLINEYLNVGGLKNNNRLTIMGDDKHTNIWKYTDGRYEYAPFTGGGNITLKNFTIVADHEGEWITANGAYAAHVDHPNSEGEVLLDDCILVSYQDAALGSGTSKNQIISLNNVDLYHYANSNAGGSTGRWHGALFYHTANLPGATGQKLNLNNVYAYSKYGPAIQLQSSGQGDQDVLVTATGVTGRSDHYESFTGSAYEDRISIANANGKIIMSENNRNNNSDKLNHFNVQKVELTDSTGKGIKTNDLNNIKQGSFIADGATGALNTPTTEYYMGYAVKYSDTLVVQEAYTVLVNFRKYRRQCVNGSWSLWYPVNDLGTAVTTTSRPTDRRPGYMTFDSTLKKPIWWDGGKWVDANGATV